MNKRLVLLCLVCCLAGGTSACSRARAPSPSSTTVPANPTQVASEPPSGQPSGTDEADETAVATSYYRAIVAQSYNLAFTYFDADAVGPDGGRMTLPAFLRLAQSMDAAEGPVTQFSTGVAQSMVVMTNYRQRMGPYHAHLQLKHETAGWRVVAVDRI